MKCRHSTPWFFWKPCTMAHRNDPNDIVFNFIEKTIWRYDHLTEGKFRKFRYESSGFREVLEPSQNFFGPISKFGCRRRFILPNICKSRQKLGSGRRCKANFHDGSWAISKSASARTVSRSYPSPVSISLSPLAKRRSRSLSCSD